MWFFSLLKTRFSEIEIERKGFSGKICHSIRLAKYVFPFVRLQLAE